MRKVNHSDSVVNKRHTFTKRISRLVKYKQLKASLKRKRKREILLYTHCKNCGTELHGPYCHKCGQFALDLNQSWWSYIANYLDNTYMFEGRLVNTLKYILTRPGKLSKEAITGRINSYLHPLKFYMFTSVFFFILFSFELNMIENQGSNKDTFSAQTSDSVATDITEKQISVSLDDISSQAKQDSLITKGQISDTADNYSTEKATNRLNNDKNTEKFVTNLTRDVKENSPKLMLIMIPVLALIIKLFNRKKCKKYLYCLVFSLHYMTATILILSLIIIIDAISLYMRWELLDVVSNAMMWMLIPAWVVYLIIAMRNFFEIRWIAAILKSIAILLLYWFVSVVVIIAYLLIFFIPDNIKLIS